MATALAHAPSPLPLYENWKEPQYHPKLRPRQTRDFQWRNFVETRTVQAPSRLLAFLQLHVAWVPLDDLVLGSSEWGWHYARWVHTGPHDESIPFFSVTGE